MQKDSQPTLRYLVLDMLYVFKRVVKKNGVCNKEIKTIDKN